MVSLSGQISNAKRIEYIGSKLIEMVTVYGDIFFITSTETIKAKAVQRVPKIINHFMSSKGIAKLEKSPLPEIIK